MDGIRAPTQQRGHEALDKLLNAGSELLAERGSEGFTLTEVSKRAGVSYGAMYWRIESKEALLNAIHERFDQRINPKLELFSDPEEWEGLDIFELVDKAVRIVSEVFTENPGLLRALSLYASSSPEMTARATSSVHRGAQTFVDLVAPRLSEAGHPESEIAAARLFTCASGALASRVTWPEFHLGPEYPWSDVVDDICTMSVGLVRESLQA